MRGCWEGTGSWGAQAPSPSAQNQAAWKGTGWGKNSAGSAQIASGALSQSSTLGQRSTLGVVKSAVPRVSQTLHTQWGQGRPAGLALVAVLLPNHFLR